MSSKTRASRGKTSARSNAPVTRGQRKLNFSTSTSSKSSDSHYFRGKTFFLDLPGYNNIDYIEYELTERGGTVERKFTSEVKYLITNQQAKGRSAGSQVDSPRGSTPSPDTPTSGTGTRGGGALSPSADGTHLTEAPGSRAAMMLAAASKGKKKSKDLCALAEGWGCKVLTVNELLKELKKLKPLPKKADTSKKTAVDKVRKLKPPFLKAEDTSYAFRPLVYETRRWPHPDVTSSSRSCPFDTPKKGKSRRPASPKEEAVGGQPISSPEAAVVPLVKERRRPGYCECCAVRYRDLSQHLKSSRHLEYANTEENFTSLDVAIAEGTKFEDFLSSVRSRANHSKKCSTPPRQRSPRSTNSPYRTMVNLFKHSEQCRTPPRRTSPRVTNSPYKTVVNLVTPPSPDRTRPPPTTRSSPKSLPRATTSPNTDKTIVIDDTGGFASPKCGQLLLTAVKTSPQPHVNCTPIVDPSKKVVADKGKECTPGFITPSPPTRKATTSKRKAAGGSRVDPVTRALLQNTDRVSMRVRVQKEREVCTGSDGRLAEKSTKKKCDTQRDAPTKNGKYPNCNGGDVVPETPEKDSVKNRTKNSKQSSALVNLQSLVDNITAKATALSKAPPKQRFILASDIKSLVDEITQHPPSSPIRSAPLTSHLSPLAAAASATAVRKSPRLAEIQLQRFRPSVTTRTEYSTECSRSALIPNSLVVSYDLSRIHVNHRHRRNAISTPTTTTSLDGREHSVTPEIPCQSGCRMNQQMDSGHLSDQESPLTGVMEVTDTVSVLTATSERQRDLSRSHELVCECGEEQFDGVSQDSVPQALPNNASGCNHTHSLRSCSKVSVDHIAQRLAARNNQQKRLTRKRRLDQSDSDDVGCHLSPSPAKRRRVSFSETTPSPTLRERLSRRSPLPAKSRKLGQLSSN